jgi:hypothetical protein
VIEIDRHRGRSYTGPAKRRLRPGPPVRGAARQVRIDRA